MLESCCGSCVAVSKIVDTHSSGLWRAPRSAPQIWEVLHTHGGQLSPLPFTGIWVLYSTTLSVREGHQNAKSFVCRTMQLIIRYAACSLPIHACTRIHKKLFVGLMTCGLEIASRFLLLGMVEALWLIGRKYDFTPVSKARRTLPSRQESKKCQFLIHHGPPWQQYQLFA